MRSRHNHTLAIAAVSGRCLARIAVQQKAVHYACAAHGDERNDFPYAAATEWRKAAELFGSDTSVAEYCWRPWERIVQLPRRLAGPISDSLRFVLADGECSPLDSAGTETSARRCSCYSAPTCARSGKSYTSNCARTIFAIRATGNTAA
jgi:hypothetical protein